MSNFDDKTQTFKFDPISEEKPQRNRVSDDEFSAARRGKSYENYNRKEEKGNVALIVVAIILAVLLIGVIVAGIFILKTDNEAEPPVENEIILEEEKEEEPPEVLNVTTMCNIIFYPESVIAKDGGYSLLADLYDEEMYKFDNRKLIINDDTDIRQDGKRLTPRALIYIIENSGGDMPVFEGEIREEDGAIVSISFEAPQEEEIPEEEIPQEVIPEEETPSEEIPEEATGGEVIE